MVVGVATAMVISVIATCVGSLYYCNEAKECIKRASAKICDDISGVCVDSTEEGSRVSIEKEDKTEKEPKKTPSSVLKKQRTDVSKKFISDRENGERITSIEWTKRTIFPSKITNVVPVRPPRRRQECSKTSEDSSGRFSSTERRRSSTNDGSTDVSRIVDNCHGVKRVKARIEFYPREISSPGKKISNSSKSQSSTRDVYSATEESTLKATGERSAVTSLNTKNDLSAKVKRRKTINAIAQCENGETEGPSLPPTSWYQYPSNADRSIMFQLSRMANASTSTKISSHAHESKDFIHNGQISSVQEIWKRSSCNTEEYNITILREVLSFLSNEKKDCALELSTSRTKNDENGECTGSTDDDSTIINVQIRTYHRTNGGFREKSKSSLMKMYGKLSGRLRTNDKERSDISSKEPSSTRLSSTGSTYSLSSTDRSSYYTIRLSEVDRAIFEKKNRKKGKVSRLNRVKKLSKVFQCQK